MNRLNELQEKLRARGTQLVQGADGKPKLQALDPADQEAFERLREAQQNKLSQPYVSQRPAILEGGHDASELLLQTNRGHIDNARILNESIYEPTKDNSTRRAITEYDAQVDAQARAFQEMQEGGLALRNRQLDDRASGRDAYIDYARGADTKDLITKLLIGAGLMFS